MTKRHIKIPNITNHQGKANQNQNEISHLSECLFSKRQEISVGKVVEKRKLLCIVGGNINWYSYSGKLYGDSSKNEKLKCHTI